METNTNNENRNRGQRPQQQRRFVPNNRNNAPKRAKNDTWMVMAAVVLAGLLVCIGLCNVTEQPRYVSVKGLAEMEVKADKVTWPMTYMVLTNDMSTIYGEVKATNEKVAAFLKSKGLSEEEISFGAPEVADLKADRYNNERADYRYHVTNVITVTSRQVDLVRSLINEQGELLRQGVVLSNDYRYNVEYAYTGLNDIKPQMIEEATHNARATAEKFAKDSDSSLGGIRRASQGQFSIENRDQNTPYIKRVRVVTTIDYLLE